MSDLVRGGVIGLQMRMRQIGRIRIGTSTPRGNGKIPSRAETFILTSADKAPLEAAKEIYGGSEIESWNGEYKLVTQATELDVYISQVPISQAMELWEGGGCKRRCNGQFEQISGGECQCPLDDPEAMKTGANSGKCCKLVTRLSVILCKLPGVGVWRIDTSSFYAATELPMTAQALQSAAARGQMIPARLAFPIRTSVRNGQTKKFPVLELRVDLTPAEIVGAASMPAPPVPIDMGTGEMLEPGAPALPAADEDMSYLTEVCKLSEDDISALLATCSAKSVDWRQIVRSSRKHNKTSLDAMLLAAQKVANEKVETAAAE